MKRLLPFLLLAACGPETAPGPPGLCFDLGEGAAFWRPCEESSTAECRVLILDTATSAQWADTTTCEQCFVALGFDPEDC